jgi:8-oxo-dGTP pyrophosphatase MutT (NUDIX family)
MTRISQTGSPGQLLPLSRAAIVERLQRPPPRPDPLDLHLSQPSAARTIMEAAVMIPLVPRGSQVHVLLTQRTAHLSDHAGQISFPGGRVEPADESRTATALRETEEEIGIAADRVSLLGRLPDYEMSSGFRITPVVGWIEPPFGVRPDPFEVAAVFEAPLAYFLDPANYRRREYRFDGRHRHYVAIPFEGRYIWGATAGMLNMLCRMLAD